MRLFSYRVLLTSFAVLLAASCGSKPEEHSRDGDWEPIQVDKEEVVFTKEGGTQIVTELNYPVWWIASASIKEGDNWVVYPNDSPRLNCFEGDWFHVSVPDNAGRNTLIISVDNNIMEESRQCILDMVSGDVFILAI